MNHFSRRICAEWNLPGPLRSMVELLVQTEDDFFYLVNKSKGNSGRFFFILHEIRKKKMSGKRLTYEQFDLECKIDKRHALQLLFLQKITDNDVERMKDYSSKEIYEIHHRLPVGTTFSIFALYLD